MNRSGIRRAANVPASTTTKGNTQDYQFASGLNTNAKNDDLAPDEWRYITDAREVLIGQWRTRQGNDLFSIPIGEAVNVSQVATTGASNFSFSTTTYFAQKLTAASSGCLTALEANIRNTASGTGTIVLALHSDVAGAVGIELFRTTLAASAVTSSYQYVKGRSIQCPNIVSGTSYWVVGLVQDGGTNSYQVSTTTAASTGSASTNAGTTWASQAFAFNVKLSTSTAGPVKGAIRVKRPSGTTYTFFAHGSNLYSVNEATGVTTSVDSGLDAAATYVRFAFVNDTLYYVQGTTKPRKYDFTTASSVAGAPENASTLAVHKGVVFYGSSTDVNKSFYTNFGLYDTFTSTDFLYIDAPKTGDPVNAITRLNGNLYYITRNNKFTLFGSQNASFQLSSSTGHRGTYSQESVAYNDDYVYLASDDGIFQFNGAEEKNLASPKVLDWWMGLLNKSNTVLEIYKNRLYVFYTPNGEAQNTNCKVYNIVYNIWESDDTNTCVQRTYTRNDNDGYFLQGSNRVGMLMHAERPTNDYNSMGEPLTYELRTSYNPAPGPHRKYVFTTGAENKRVAKFRPHFDTVVGSYSIQVGYALDFSDVPQYVNVLLSGAGPRFNQGYRFNTGVRFGSLAQVNPTDNSPIIPGFWRRLQIRYKHYAAREPVSFDGHILSVETQRMA